MKNILMTLLIIAMAFSLSAQSDLNAKRWNFELGFGINTMGPVTEMDKLMVEYGYDATSINIFSGHAIQHPHYHKVGASYQLAFSHYINQRSLVGLQFNYSLHSEIFGESETAGYLFVRFRSMSFIPIYTYEIDNRWEAQVGPALMINKGEKTNSAHLDTENYSRMSPGLLAGISWKLWNGEFMDGKLSTSYLYGVPTKMGPYSSERWIFYPTESVVKNTIPESKIGFGHLRISFVIAFHDYPD